MTEPALTKRRRWPLFLGIGGLVVWVAALMAGIVALFVTAAPVGRAFERHWDEETLRGGGTDKVAVVPIEGEITAGGSSGGVLGGRSLGARDWVGMLEQAIDDDDVKAVVLRIDSPGGAVVASDDVHQMVLRVRAAHKPVVASMGDEAASGGYYIASAADSIVANEATLTGSIGVIAIFMNLEGTAAKIGAKPVVIKSGAHKDIGSPFRSLTPEERRILQSLIDDAYAKFVRVVSSGRHLSEQRVRQIGDGRVYSGTQAMSLGLVDRLGNLDDAFREARALARLDEARLVQYQPPGIGLGALLGGRIDIAREIREAFGGAAQDALGVPAKPGLQYLWLP